MLFPGKKKKKTDFQFDVEPSSVTTFDGHTAEFHCIAPCSGILWLINDLIAQAVRNIATRTETVPRTDGQAGQESTLWITANVHANNSVIKCGIEDTVTNFETYSSPAHLTIQGTHVNSNESNISSFIYHTL